MTPVRFEASVLVGTKAGVLRLETGVLLCLKIRPLLDLMMTSLLQRLEAGFLQTNEMLNSTRGPNGETRMHPIGTRGGASVHTWFVVVCRHLICRDSRDSEVV